jgi:hypothetical protein
MTNRGASFSRSHWAPRTLKEANAAAVHVLADFNRTTTEAETLLKERPLMTTLTDAQIKRMAEAHYASILSDDEGERREGTGSEPVFQSIARQLAAAGIEHESQFTVGALPEAGLSDREIIKRQSTLDLALGAGAAALARGDISFVREQLEELLCTFQINLDRKSEAYRKLGMAVLTADVRAWKDVERRNTGEPVDTPQAHALLPSGSQGHEGGTLREALSDRRVSRKSIRKPMVRPLCRLVFR